VIISLLLMKLPPYQQKKSGKNVLSEFSEGFVYVRKNPELKNIILLLAIVSLLVQPYNTALPEFAKVVFHGGASTFGYLTGSVGFGALLGTIFLASRRPDTHLKRILFISIVAMGVGLICFSSIKNFPVAILFVVLAGFGGMTQYTACNILVQTESEPQMRGRAIGILLMAILGMMPLGSLLVGRMSQYVGAPATVLGQGVIAIVVALAYAKFLSRKPQER
jgi:MFS family permease